MNNNKEIELENYETENKKMPKGNLKISKRAVTILTAGALVLTMGITGIVHLFLRKTNETQYIPQKTAYVLSIKSDNTQLDEIIAMISQDAAIDLDELEEIVNLSEKLHSLNLEQHIGELEKYPLPENYDVKNLADMIETYEELSQNSKIGVLSKEDRELTKLCLTLESYERATNNLLSNSSYGTLINYGCLTAKAKLLDACEFKADEVSNIKLGAGEKNYVLSFTDKETGKVYNVPVEKGSNLNSKGYVYDVIDSIYEWRDNTKLANNTGDTYDGKRNKNILNGINMLKTLTLMDCEINNEGKLVVTTTMSEVKDKIKTLTKDERSK